MIIKGRIAIIGRPNAGKSTLFNRLTKSQASIVANISGLTRDTIPGYTSLEDTQESEHRFEILDTSGYENNAISTDLSPSKIWEKTKITLKTCQLIILLFDGKDGLQIYDKELIEFLRKEKLKSIYVVNKIDGKEQQHLSWSFEETGLPLISISAAHNKGIVELKEKIRQHIEPLSSTKKISDVNASKIAIIGKPNAGKSSIMNRLLGKDISLVSPQEGTTRDSICIPFIFNKNQYFLIDTAGMRRKSNINNYLEKECVKRSIQAINEAKLVICIVDSTIGLTDQDIRLIQLTQKQYKPILIIINKWDLITSKSPNKQRDYKNNIFQNKIRNADYIPMHFTSCLTNSRVSKIMSYVETLLAQYDKKTPTAIMNKIVDEITTKQPPRLIKSTLKRPKFYYTTQITKCPPTVIVKCNVPNELQVSYKRYFIKQIRIQAGFSQIPLKVIFQDKHKKEDLTA
jgi:GTPase